MRILTNTKFQFKRNLFSVAVFYGILFLSLLLIYIPDILSGGIEDNTVVNVEMSSVIFLFIVGLNYFKEELKFGMANGCSRKTLVCSGVLSIMLVSALMTFVDTLFAKILLETSRITYNPLFSILYGKDYGTIMGIVEGLLWTFALYTFIALCGYFLTILYYRMNTMLKIAVSVGVPVLFMMVLPYFDFRFDLNIYKNLGDFIQRVMGLYNQVNFWIGIGSLAVGIIILAALQYLLARRAPIKE